MSAIRIARGARAVQRARKAAQLTSQRRGAAVAGAAARKAAGERAAEEGFENLTSKSSGDHPTLRQFMDMAGGGYNEGQESMIRTKDNQLSAWWQQALDMAIRSVEVTGEPNVHIIMIVLYADERWRRAFSETLERLEGILEDYIMDNATGGMFDNEMGAMLAAFSGSNLFQKAFDYTMNYRTGGYDQSTKIGSSRPGTQNWERGKHTMPGLYRGGKGKKG